ncbi:MULTISPECIES: tripartite tricarboxylate transporter substrate binding protein [unclassified Polaromonas]|jgi:tripartite-type tricarboxylate transporter receptor subunit TctC|uniref:Bug family tripartite tricarboxylate transporter substrate binding protein n=1 Tax=unclassified Polaromonas TaxID=2638319 RepID=UPI0018C9BA86|nr:MULTISPECIES: tripartite tricarboxylate transporter substrate binding protein [unclassified Polaromonas]MBG6071288.1 tripartite-type tricarboxylate transporter receptor subunit TctC [Polaromonas sp. CG_9.7]MBG6113288.1 tripartite-type tricarboxylate transporter receptor subunit TctC [Polaromonas sp. CG_9.2]MDH6185823.1 tripartite-type tricarboxylate transporter receptor subunit TctC [Polaromonas sp. CG_23.6]
MKKSFLTLIAAVACASTTLVYAQTAEFPTKPIRLVVGFAAGGPTDIIARVLAKDMSILLGQTIFIDNKAGASSMIATREVKNAAPDGYTLLFSSLGLNVNPILLGEQAGYNPRTDFTPISNAATLPLVAVQAYDSPVKSMAELLKTAQSKPEAVSFASSGNGGSGHLAGELLGTLAKAKMLHVPYKGNGPALLEVMAGRVDFMFYPVIGLADNVAAKRIKILAVGTAKRLAQFPDAPTMSEVGFPGFEATAPWVGMLAPAKTPPAVVNRLNDAMVKALAKPEVKAQLEKLGAVIVGDSPAEFAAYLKRDYDRWDHVIKAAAIKADVN